jgi:hypothetical protein
MKKIVTLLTMLFVLAVGCAAPRPASSQDRKPETQATPGGSDELARAGAVMKELRNKLLTAKPDELLDGEDAKAKVWGVLMDVAFPSGVATLVSLRDGTASLYTTTGGGIIGGYTAKTQAQAFVAAAEKSLTRMQRTEAFPYPAAGRVKFYVLTRDGVFTAEAALQELGEKKHGLWPLYYSADEVLTQLRLASEKRQP